jgi:hypothetical protein
MNRPSPFIAAYIDASTGSACCSSLGSGSATGSSMHANNSGRSMPTRYGKPLRPLQPRVDLVFLACLDGVLRSHLDVGLCLGYLLAHLGPCCVAVDGNDVWAVMVWLVDLEILRTVATAKQSLAMHTGVSLFDPRLQHLLLDPARSPALLSR